MAEAPSVGSSTLEVTCKGEVVWEYWNPHRAGREGELIATLFEVVRLPAVFPIDWVRRE